MRRITVISVVVASVLAVPRTALSQTSPVNDLAAVVHQVDDGSRAAVRLAPSPTSLVFLQRFRSQDSLIEERPRHLTAIPQAQVRNRRGVPFMVAGGVRGCPVRS